MVFDKSKYKELLSTSTPDAVFPNNWISTECDGSIDLYPMKAENRTSEKDVFRYISEMFINQF